MRYEKPLAIRNDEIAEGIYTLSGDGAGESTELKCESTYMQGTYHASQATIYGNEYKRKDRGCEGCPAAQGGACRLGLGPFGSSLMPTWERNHENPEDIFIYWG